MDLVKRFLCWVLGCKFDLYSLTRAVADSDDGPRCHRCGREAWRDAP